MRGGQVLQAETDHVATRWWWREQEAAAADLAARSAEVLRQKGVEDGVDAGVSVRQAVGKDAEGKGGVGQREAAELHPHGDDVVRHPADGEGCHDQQHRLSCL